MKRSQPKRDWELARAKVEAEGTCRILDCWTECDGPLEAAHIVGRDRDKDAGYKVRPERVMTLCQAHHRRYDPHTRGNELPVDVWNYLTFDEQFQAIEDAGGYWLAVKRCSPVAYRAFNERERVA